MHRKIPETLLRIFLRRYPVPIRQSFFGFLGQYAWLKDVLDELRPELFPPTRDTAAAATEGVDAKPDPEVLAILARSEIAGRLGYYKAEIYLGQRGNGYLFEAIDLTTKRPVVIKEFLLSASQFTKTEALQRQNRFQQLAGFQLADGRLQDFRVMQPIEAIVDREASELCFLVTDGRDRAPTLRQHLQDYGALPAAQAQDLLSQILQTLDFLHCQKFSFATGVIQAGLVHGNLSLDSVLWTEQQTQPFVYLTDLWLWEQWFEPHQARRSIQVTAETVQQDLSATGEIGKALVQGLEPDAAIAIAPDLAQILDGLQTAKYDSAETARRQLLQLATRSPTAIAPLEQTSTSATAFSPWTAFLGLLLLGLAAGAFQVFPRLRLTEAKSIAKLPVTTCCLAEVSAIPPGEYVYTAVKNGTWWSVLQQRNLLQRDQSLTDVLSATQPNLKLQFVPGSSLEQVLAQVRSGDVDFAVLPLLAELPSDLLFQEIAYDGLAAVVSFSYAERQQGLPTALKGQLTLEQLQRLYEGQIEQWNAISGATLPVRRYVSNNPEAIVLFEQRLLKAKKLETFSVSTLPPLDLLRQVLRDFEGKGIGSIGIVPLSEIWGQCSVYPLALGPAGQTAVQPMVLSTGEQITPGTDLCARKGAFAADPDRFQTGSYPLSYPIVVVYPRNNRRSAIGKKFAELMRTIEGQRFLRSAGLVPLNQVPRQPSPSPSLLVQPK
jgi:hypothetical protein